MLIGEGEFGVAVGQCQSVFMTSSDRALTNYHLFALVYLGLHARITLQRFNSGSSKKAANKNCKGKTKTV